MQCFIFLSIFQIWYLRGSAEYESMCDKFVYTISCNDRNDEQGHGAILNDTLFNVLLNHKNIINKFGANKDWDTFKKQTNLYELVFTTESPSIASVNPFSRSFFKHWEMLHDFKDELAFPDSAPIKCAFLAEGPGGFIEAFVKYRATNASNVSNALNVSNASNDSIASKTSQAASQTKAKASQASQTKAKAAQDTLYGVTLISSNRIVPSWKFSREYLDTHNLKLLYGPAGDGSLYKMINIDDFVQEIGQGQCDYVTSDGGFDFSNSFYDQEASSLLLITCEIYTAMMLQKPGGAFLLKIYDIGMDQTKQLLYVLFMAYDSITFVKPHTSRPANSEKYVLCRGFKGSKHMDILRSAIMRNEDNMVIDLDSIDFTSEFSESLAMFNVVFVVKQIVHINMTATQHNENANKQGQKQSLVKSQLQHAVRWCHKYHIPINMENFHHLCLKQTST